MGIKNALKQVNWKTTLGIIVAIIITQLHIIPNDIIIVLSITIAVAVVAYIVYCIIRKRRWDALVITVISLLLLGIAWYGNK